MRWTTDDVARMRLLSQRLLDPLPGPAAVVRHLTCTQGQDFPGSSTSLALRTASRSLADVHAAYDAGHIVRSWPMRGTLFVVAAADLRWMLHLTGDRVISSTVRRRAELGIDAAHLEAAEQVAREVLTGPGLVRADLLAAWTAAGLDVGTGRGYHSIFHLAVRGVLCLGPMEGTEQRFVLTEEWLPPAPPPHEAKGDDAELVAEWFRRYMRSHGPAPEADFLWWTKLLRRDLTPALAQATEELASIEVDGVRHWVDPEILESYPGRKRATTAPLLLPGFDEIVLGYGDRSAVMTDEQERERVVPGKNGVFRPTLVRAGRAVGTWKRLTTKGRPVEVTPFDPPLTPALERAVPRLAEKLPA